jgi:hypothetical protein
MAQLREFHALATSILKNAKGEVLLTALRRGFDASAEAQRNQGAATLQQKAVIFTESRRTQEYLFSLLKQTEFAGKVMLFNGTNSDPHSKGIYRRWLGAARRHRSHHGLPQRRHARRTRRALPRLCRHSHCHRGSR